MTVRHVKYQLANEAGYKLKLAKIGFTEYDAYAYMHKSNFPDAEVVRSLGSTDIELIKSTCLMTVNGYVHDIVTYANSLYIPGCTSGMLRAKANVTGLLDFGALTSDLKRIKITSSMVTEDLNIQAYNKVIITFPQPVIQPMLVMAGYLIPYNPEFFYRISDSAFALNLSKLNYTEKLYELFRYRDIFKDLDVAISATNTQMVDAEEIRSIQIIRKFLSLHNSFMIDLGTPNLSLSKVFLEHSTIPGLFKTQTSPNMPLILGYGKISEYGVYKRSGTHYEVTSQDSHYENHLISYMNQAECNVLNGHRLPGDNTRLSEGFFLDITADI